MTAHSDDPDLPTIGTRHHDGAGLVREVTAVDPAGQWVRVRYHWPNGSTSMGRLGYWPGVGWEPAPERATLHETSS